MRARTQVSPVWRVATPVTVVVAGLLVAVSANSSEGTDLRPGRYGDLAGVVETEADEYDVLASRVSALTDEVDDLTGAVDSREVVRTRQRAALVRDPAGLVARRGPGISIQLSDAPRETVEAAAAETDPEEQLDINRLVVHQQDVQAVVNALWVGGATAVTVAGQRVVTTTGIKCEGNAVQLQGIPYPQPFVIEGVGDPEALLDAVEADDYLQDYRADAANPAIDVGWDLDLEADVEAPAYDGLLDLSYAEPLR